ncbi:MAG TPA: thioredoxin domain-containing protein [Longimicrobiales bacterium]|nr:thioredoxin domain-containing protein [Longimicrobiales bacterium]
MSHAIEITDATFGTEIENRGGLCVLDCWAPWCMPCLALGPAIDQLAQHFHDRARVAKLNIDDNPLTAARLAVRSIPALLFFRDGVLVDRIVGLVPRAEIAVRIERHLRTGPTA